MIEHYHCPRCLERIEVCRCPGRARRAAKAVLFGTPRLRQRNAVLLVKLLVLIAALYGTLVFVGRGTQRSSATAAQDVTLPPAPLTYQHPLTYNSVQTMEAR